MKKIILIMISILVITGCAKEKIEVVDKTYNKIIIETNIENKSDDNYLVYLLTPGMIPEDKEDAIYNGYVGPFETDVEGKVEIDLSYQDDLFYYLEAEENTKKGYMQVIVATKEDKYLRNPLNEETFIKFNENNNEETKFEYGYYSSVETVKVNGTDKYPDNVLSLTFRDATFVIKLSFLNDPGKKSYEVAIHKPSTTGSGIGMYRLARISREFQYYDTPFFQTDNLKTWSGTIVITDYDTNQNVNYEGNPTIVTFDESGKCIQGDIINIKVLN